MVRCLGFPEWARKLSSYDFCSPGASQSLTQKRDKLPVGSYHVPFLGDSVLSSGIYYHKVGYPEKGYGMSLQLAAKPRAML